MAALWKVVSPAVWRWTFVVLIVVVGLGVVTPQLEARGWMLLGRWQVASVLPFLVWGTLAVLGVWAWHEGTLPELLIGFLIAGGVAALASALIATKVLDDVGLGAVPDATPGPTVVVTLPAALLAEPGTSDAKLPAGKVTVVVVQRHAEADGKSTVETKKFEGTLLADVAPGADVRVSVSRGDGDVDAMAVVENLADAETIYLFLPSP